MNKLKLIIKKYWLLIIFGTFIFIVLFVGLFSGFGSFGHSPDARRIADLRQTQFALSLYYEKFKSYPIVSGEDNWQALIDELVNVKIGIISLSQDPANPKKSYKYGFSKDGQHYILKAILDNEESPALVDDLDGLIYGIDCGQLKDKKGEKEYCVG